MEGFAPSPLGDSPQAISTPLADPSHDLLVLRAHEAGRAAHPSVSLAHADFAQGVVAMARRRAQRLGVGGAGPTTEALAAIPAADAYLAIACDLDVRGAWDRLMALHVPRLARLARHHGAGLDEAEDIARSLPGDLCVAPADGSTRTRLGAYDGSGSLAGWLGVIVMRRVLDRPRSRLVALDASGDPDGEDFVAEPVAVGPEPGDTVAAAELAGLLVAAVEAAWPSLTANEALAVLLKFRDGLAQKDIARILGVGDPRVSRIVQSALDKLRRAVLDALPAGFARGVETGDAWSVLRAALEAHVATLRPRGDSSAGSGA